MEGKTSIVGAEQIGGLLSLLCQPSSMVLSAHRLGTSSRWDVFVASRCSVLLCVLANLVPARIVTMCHRHVWHPDTTFAWPRPNRGRSSACARWIAQPGNVIQPLWADCPALTRTLCAGYPAMSLVAKLGGSFGAGAWCLNMLFSNSVENVPRMGC